MGLLANSLQPKLLKAVYVLYNILITKELARQQTGGGRS
jgi:hypothetical protein